VGLRFDLNCGCGAVTPGIGRGGEAWFSGLAGSLQRLLAPDSEWAEFRDAALVE
jgi:hypothetical protein